MAPWRAHDTALARSAGTSTVGCPVAMAAHRGELWCLWVDTAGQCWYAMSDQKGHMGTAAKFPCSTGGQPGLTNVSGQLHAVVMSSERGKLAHYRFEHDCDGAGHGGTWAQLGEDLALTAIAPNARANLCGYHNKLFAVFLSDGQRPYYSIWSSSSSTPSGKPDTGSWAAPRPVEIGDAGPVFIGTPTMFVLNGGLNLVGVTLSPAATDGIDALAYRGPEAENVAAYRFDYIHSIWDWSHDHISGGGRQLLAIKNGCGGLTGASVGSHLYLGLTDHDGAVSIVAFEHGKGWGSREVVVDNKGRGGMASDIPQLAVVAGRVHCVFHDSSAEHGLKWFSHPAVDTKLLSWMSELPGTLAVSDLTIPGTHDSCARSDIPFVRTQYLSVGQQLAHGIRSLDLRLRRHDNDGRLYCYHGGIPIAMPRRLSFEEVMADVWAFLSHELSSSETVLVSIDNDDRSSGSSSNLAVFYKAVAAAIGSAAKDSNGSPRWFTKPVTPTLEQVRGRAVLLRRFWAEPTAELGLDLSGWPDNVADFTFEKTNQVPVHIQDHWRYTDRVKLEELVADKCGLVKHMVDLAADGGSDGGSDGLYINFCSAVGDPMEHGEVAEAKWIAAGGHSDLVGRWIDGINVRVRAMALHFVLQREMLLSPQPQQGRFRSVPKSGPTRLGIVNLDFPELPDGDDLVAVLIDLNFAQQPAFPRTPQTLQVAQM